MKPVILTISAKKSKNTTLLFQKFLERFKVATNFAVANFGGF